MDRANVSATLMEHLCNHDWHGYTQGNGRWGDGEGVCNVDVEGETFSVEQGDRDCSSAVIDCWRQALKGTPYEASLNGATYTGNMKSVFSASGLFEVQPMSFIAQRGDIYLNEVNHTAMCVSAVPDMLAEFSLNELGGIIGGTVGDQTGNESSVHAYYVPSFGWDLILHYNGKADGQAESDAERIERERVEGLPELLKKYKDLWPGQWYVDSVNECVKLKWMTGTSDSTWEPDNILTRAMAIQVIARAMNADVPDLPFDDIANWYTEAAMWAANAGILEGSNGQMRPNDACTRAEFATFLWRAKGKPEADTFEGEPEWSAKAVGWAVDAGVFSDKQNVRPSVACKRAEAAAMAVRALQ